MDTMASSELTQEQAQLVARSEELVDRFLDAIWMERGLSQNTLGAYRADLMTRITSYNVCYTKLLRASHAVAHFMGKRMFNVCAGNAVCIRRRCNDRKCIAFGAKIRWGVGLLSAVEQATQPAL